MALIELPKDWTQSANVKLADIDQLPALVSQLTDRWRKNSASTRPKAIFIPPAPNLHYQWGEFLELFLISDACTAQAANNVVQAMKSAFDAVNPTIENGTVWLADLLALRRIDVRRFPDVAGSALDLMLTGLETIPEIFPAPSFEMYEFFYSVYDLVTKALVSELGEPALVEQEYLEGARLTRSLDPSLFGAYRVWPSEQTVQRDFLANRQQNLIDALFDTLAGCNPEFEALPTSWWGGRLPETAYLGLQRELDIHWYRLSFLVSEAKLVSANMARVYIREAGGRDASFQLCELNDASLFVQVDAIAMDDPNFDDAYDRPLPLYELICSEPGIVNALGIDHAELLEAAE